MHQLFSDFLAQYGYCPIPGVGTIRAERQAAKFQAGEGLFHPPFTQYRLAPDVEHKEEMLNHMARSKRMNVANASAEWDRFGNTIREDLANGHHFRLNQLTVSKPEMDFEISPAHAASFLYPIPAKWHIRENASHEMLVGDRTTNTREMNEFLAVKEEGKNRSWLYALAIFFVMAALAGLAYFYGMFD